MTTVEKNAVIASFMGYEKYYANGYWNFIYEDDNHRTDVDLHYHHDWDWLMLVVEKIEKDYDFSVTTCWQHCIIVSHTFSDLRIEKESSTKISAVYEAVLQFIQWYNQKQETK